MEEKNELNDLLLSGKKEGGNGKKFFLIAAGVLLTFFVGVGIMKFVGSSESKQPLPITSIEQSKEANASAPAPIISQSATPANNASAPIGEDKLNEIVKKLQEDAKAKAEGANASVESSAAPKAVEAQAKKEEPKTAAVAPNVKSQNHQTDETRQPKKEETHKKEAPKETPKPAVEKKVEPKPEPKPEAKQAAAKQPEAVAKETKEEEKPKAKKEPTFYVQVGIFKNEAAIKELESKIKASGYGDAIKHNMKDNQAVKILAGPFSSKADADKALPTIKSKVKSDAFVVRE